MAGVSRRNVSRIREFQAIPAAIRTRYTCEMERDWSYFALVALGAGILWLLHRRRQGGGRGVVPIVAAVLAIIGVLYIAVRG